MARKKTSAQSATKLDIQTVQGNDDMKTGNDSDNPVEVIGIDSSSGNEEKKTEQNTEESETKKKEVDDSDKNTVESSESSDSSEDSEDENHETEKKDQDSDDSSDDEDYSDAKSFTGSQMKAIIDRKTKILNNQITELQKELSEAKNQIEEAKNAGMLQGKVEQRKAEISKKFGFDTSILPDTEKGLDNFEKQIGEYAKGHTTRSIPVAKVEKEDDDLPDWIRGVS